MSTLTIKGHEIVPVLARDSFSRRAVQYKNSIITALGKLGIPADDVDVELEAMAIRNLPASATWYVDGYRLYYSYKASKRFVDNLYIVRKVIELEVEDLLTERKTFEEFLLDFTEKSDVEQMRKEARELLGVGEHEHSMEVIDKAYKELAKKHHPDKDNGDIETFKKINNAHKILKRELH